MMLWWMLCAHAGEVQFNTDTKSFFIAGFPYEHLLMMETPYGQAFIDERIKLRVSILPNLRLVAHHAITMGTVAPPNLLTKELAAMGQETNASVSSGFMTGVGLSAPEVITLSWKAFEESDLLMQGRTDRFFLELSAGNTELRIGRQPISFGYGLAFNPMDLIQPFGVATIDGEYKPGVDAIRGDVYVGMSTQITAALAYVGDWSQEGLVGALHGKTTINTTEYALFSALVRGDLVFGGGISGSLGPVGVYGDITYTLPYQEKSDAFIRSDIGFLWRPLEDTTITTSFYVQTLGASSPKDYLTFAQENPRFARREIWLMGQYYGMLSVAQQITPLLGLNVATTANLADQSTMINAGISYSVSDNTSLVLGGFYGLGERPPEVTVQDLFSNPDALQLSSEFGFYPTMVFAQLKAYQ